MHRKEDRLVHLTHEEDSLYRDHEGCALVRYECTFLLNVSPDVVAKKMSCNPLMLLCVI